MDTRRNNNPYGELRLSTRHLNNRDTKRMHVDMLRNIMPQKEEIVPVPMTRLRQKSLPWIAPFRTATNAPRTLMMIPCALPFRLELFCRICHYPPTSLRKRRIPNVFRIKVREGGYKILCALQSFYTPTGMWQTSAFLTSMGCIATLVRWGHANHQQIAVGKRLWVSWIVLILLEVNSGTFATENMGASSKKLLRQIPPLPFSGICMVSRLIIAFLILCYHL